MRGSLLLSALLALPSAGWGFDVDAGDRPVLQTPTGQGEITGGGAFIDTGGATYGETAGGVTGSGGFDRGFTQPAYVDPNSVSGRNNTFNAPASSKKNEPKKPEGKPQMPQLPQGGGGDDKGGGGGGKKGGGCSSCKGGAEQAAQSLGDRINQQLAQIDDPELKGNLTPKAQGAKASIDAGNQKISSAQDDVSKARQRVDQGADNTKEKNSGGGDSNKQNQKKLTDNAEERKTGFVEPITCSPPKADGTIAPDPTLTAPDLSQAEQAHGDAQSLTESAAGKLSAAESSLAQAESQNGEIRALITAYHAKLDSTPDLGGNSLPGEIAGAVGQSRAYAQSVEKFKKLTDDANKKLKEAIQKVKDADEKVQEVRNDKAKQNKRKLDQAKKQINDSLKSQYEQGEQMEQSSDPATQAQGRQMKQQAQTQCEQVKQDAQTNTTEYKTAAQQLDSPIQTADQAVEQTKEAAQKARQHEQN